MSNLASKVGLSILTALTGGAAWLIAEPSAKSIVTMFSPAAKAEAPASTGPAAAVDLSLANKMTGLADVARAAKRPDTALVSLTAASARLSELATKAAGLGEGDAKARELIIDDMNQAALTAARGEITAVSADGDKIAASILGDFKQAEAEMIAGGKSLDPDSATAYLSAQQAQAAIADAVAKAQETDAGVVLTAATSAEQALVTLNSYRGAGAGAIVRSKRLTFDANATAARKAAAEISGLAAGTKKSSVFDSKQKKADIKLVMDADVSAKERIATLDAAIAKGTVWDRKSAPAFASQAATAKTELQASLVSVKAAAARLAAK